MLSAIVYLPEVPARKGNPMEDAVLVDLYFARDQRALLETQSIYGSYCRSILSQIVDREDTEECFNDTLMALWRSIPPNRPEKFRLYMAKIARNLAFNRYKEKRADKRGGGEAALVLDELAECLSDTTSTEESVIMSELSQSLNSFVRELPERERTLFVRRYFYADQVQDIAEDLDLSPNHAAVILRRVREKLKKQLVKEGYDV